jgi:hypothetical protein
MTSGCTSSAQHLLPRTFRQALTSGLSWQTNLESIIRYLKPARNRTVIEKVNSSFAGHLRVRLRLVTGVA